MRKTTIPTAFRAQTSAPPRSLTIPLLITTLCLALLAGCSSKPPIASEKGAVWSGLGVSLRLPAGTWDVGEADEGNTISFTTPGHARCIALLRTPAKPNEPAWYPLRALFVEFPDKKLVRRWEVALPDGAKLPCAEYEVTIEERRVTVRAGAMRRNEWNYALAEWVFSGPSSFDALAAGLLLPATKAPESKP